MIAGARRRVRPDREHETRITMRGLNKVLLIGRLGRDPEMRYTPSGVPVTTFSLGTRRAWVTGDGARREATEWFHVVAWRRLAEICHAHLGKGSRVYIEGRLQTRCWDEGDGTRQQRLEVVAREMVVLDAGRREDVEPDVDLGDDSAEVDEPDGHGRDPGPEAAPAWAAPHEP